MEQVLGLWKPAIFQESVAINQALGRITAEDTFAVHSVPVIRASTMDGVAVKSELFEQGALGKEGGEAWKTRQALFQKSTVVENLSAPGQFITDPDREGLYKAGETLEVEIIQ